MLPLVCYTTKMIWTIKDDEQLVLLHSNKTPINKIAEILGRSPPAIKARVQKFIKEGILIGKTQVSKRHFTSEELLKFVEEYRSHDALKRASSGNPNLPNPKTIQERFGSWAEARKLAGVYSHAGTLQPHWPTVLYLVKFDGFYKVGITQRTVRERFWGYPEYELIDEVLYPDLESAYETEQEILSKVSLYEATELSGKGKTECFKDERNLSSLLELL